MGLFGIFSKPNHSKELDKLAGHIANGQREKAHRILARLEKDLRSKGDAFFEVVEKDVYTDLRGQLYAQFRDEYREKATRLEKQGDIASAIDWLGMALDFCDTTELDNEVREEIERLNSISIKETSHAGESELSPVKGYSEVQNEPEDDPEGQFEALIEMMKPHVSKWYRDQDSVFVSAFLKLQLGDFEGALAEFEELVDPDTSSPALDLEMARCLILSKRYSDAIPLLEKIWDVFGDEPMDLAESVSVPALWSECKLRIHEWDDLVQRVEEQAKPEGGDAGTSLAYGLALDHLNRTEQAVEHFHGAAKRFQLPDFAFHLARILNREGEWQSSVTLLEKQLAPSCQTGCHAGPLHFPSLHLLVDILIEHRVGWDRAEDLLRIGDRRLQGFKSRDHLLAWSRFLDASERGQEAESLRQQAEKLDPMKAQQQGIPQVKAGDDAVL